MSGGADVVEVPVVVDGVEFYAEVAETAGPVNVGLGEVLSFDGVRRTVEAVSGELIRAWTVVQPDEASVEFTLKLKAKEGKLVGLLASAESEGSLKIALKWRREAGVPAAEPGAPGEDGAPGEAATEGG